MLKLIVILVLFAPVLASQTVRMVVDLDRTPVGLSPSYYCVGDRVFVKKYDERKVAQIWEMDSAQELTLLSKHNHVGLLGTRVWKDHLLYSTFEARGENRRTWAVAPGVAKPTLLAEVVFDGSGDPNCPQTWADEKGEFFIVNPTKMGELWITDCTGEGTVRLGGLTRGSWVMQPRFIGKAGGRILILAPDAEGWQLWASDGTPEGTLNIGLVNVPDPSEETRATPDGEGVAFLVKGSSGGHLWYTDGTEGSLRKIIHVPADSESLGVQDFSILGDKYVLSIAASVAELAVLNRGEQQPTLLHQFGKTLDEDYVPKGLTHIGNLIYFADDSTFWRTDGTEDGTLCLTPGQWPSPTGFQQIGERCVFAADSGIGFSDGTVAGTQFLRGFSFSNVFRIGGKLRFTSFGRLAETDGTAKGTLELFDPVEVTGSFSPGGMVRFGDSIITYASYGTEGLVRITAGQPPVFLGPVEPQARPTQLTVVGKRIFFLTGHNQLWTSDGTPEGTIRVSPYGIKFIRSLVAANGLLYFSAEDEIHGRELWCSDGTKAGTRMVADIKKGFGWGVDDLDNGKKEIQDLRVPLGCEVASGLVFSGDAGSALCFTSGDGFTQLKDFGKSLITNVFPIGELVGVVVKGGEPRALTLWTTDGTADGTTQVCGLASAQVLSAPRYIARAGSTTWFVARDKNGAYSAWRTDGSETNTSHVCNLPDPAGDAVAFHATADGMLVWCTQTGTWLAGASMKETTQVSALRAIAVTSEGNDVYLIEAKDKTTVHLAQIVDGELSEVSIVEDCLPPREGAAVESTRVGSKWVLGLQHARLGVELWSVTFNDKKD